MRCTKAGKSRHDIHSPIIRDRVRQFLNLRRLTDDLQSIPKPLDDSSGHKHTSLQRVLRHITDFPRHGGQQLPGGRPGTGPGIHQHETAGAIRVFDHAGLGAVLTKQRGLLITSNSSNRDGGPQ